MKKFEEELIKELQAKVGEKYDFHIREIMKVNDVKLHSLNFIKKTRQVSPNVYLEGYYDKYANGSSVSKIADEIIKVVETGLNSFTKEKEMLEGLLDYQQACQKVMIKLVNIETNKEYLKDKAYKKCGDFAMVFYILIERNSKGMITTAVTDKTVDIWGVDYNVLLDDAINNMYEKLPIRIAKLESAIMDLVKDLEISVDDIEIAKTDNVYIMTNESRIEGATTIFYEGALKKFALEHNVDDVIIIPSSIHEVILIPKDGSQWVDEEMCKNMLRDVNNSEINPTEILSYNIYIYNCETDEVRIWKEDEEIAE